MISGKFPHSLASLALLQLLATCLSCSVKEDRDLCPCQLQISFQEKDRPLLHDGVLLLLSTEDNGLKVSDTLRAEAGEVGPLTFNIPAPRGRVAVSVLYPADKDALIADEGDSFSSIYMDYAVIDALGEASPVDMTLHKRFCEIRTEVTEASGVAEAFGAAEASGGGNGLVIAKAHEAAEAYGGGPAFGLEIRGNVTGYAPDGSVVKGRFRSMADGSARVPRQVDNSLQLNILAKDGITRTFALGNYIAESGYDWSAADLPDISIVIDYSRTAVTLRIDSWSREISLETVI